MCKLGKGVQKEASKEKASGEVSKDRNRMTCIIPLPLSVSVADISSLSQHAVLLAAELRKLLSSPDVYRL